MTSRKNSGAVTMSVPTVRIHDQLSPRQAKRRLREHLWGPEVVLRAADHQCLGLDIVEPIANVEGVLSAQHGDGVRRILDSDALGSDNRDRREQDPNAADSELCHPSHPGWTRLNSDQSPRWYCSISSCASWQSDRACRRRWQPLPCAPHQDDPRSAAGPRIRRCCDASTSTGLPKWLMNGLSMPFGDLGEGGIGGHSRPAIGEVDLKTRPGQRGQRSQGEGFAPGRARVSVVGRESAQIDQRLPGTHREVR